MLAGTVLTAAALPMALAAMPAAGAWEIGPWVRGENSSIGMPLRPSQGSNGSVSMALPISGRGQVGALTTAVNPLAGARQVTLRYRIDAARGTRFVAEETPSEPATVSLYFQRAGDSWSGRGRFASYRWYVPGRAVIPLSAGEHKVTIQFTETWTNVNGEPNSQVPEGYAAALQNTARIGLAFGSSTRRSHGIYATGPARFTLLALDID